VRWWRAPSAFSSVKADIHQQANLSGLDGLRNDIQDAANSFKAQMEAEVQGVRQVMAAQSAQLQQLSSEAWHRWRRPPAPFMAGWICRQQRHLPP
jgi:hypothetical protein